MKRRGDGKIWNITGRLVIVCDIIIDCTAIYLFLKSQAGLFVVVVCIEVTEKASSQVVSTIINNRPATDTY